MKKIIVVIITCLFLSGCGQKDPYKEVSFDTLNAMIEKKESFVLVIGSSDCTHCADYKTTMKDVVKRNKVTIYYIDVSKLNSTEFAKLRNKFSFTGTPTTIFVEDGKEKDAQFNRINGAKDYDTIIKRLKKNNYIK